MPEERELVERAEVPVGHFLHCIEEVNELFVIVLVPAQITDDNTRCRTCVHHHNTGFVAQKMQTTGLKKAHPTSNFMNVGAVFRF